MPIELSASQLNNARISAEELQSLLASAFGAEVDFGSSVFIVDENSAGGDAYGNAPLLSNPLVDFATMLAEFSALRDTASAEQMALDCSRIRDFADLNTAINNEVNDCRNKAIACQEEVEARQGKERINTLIKAAFELIFMSVVLMTTVLSSVVTGGAAIFVGGVALLGVLLATVQTIDAAIKVSGKMPDLDVSLSGMVAAVTECMVEKSGLTFDSDEEKQAWIANWSMGVNGMVMALQLVGGAVTTLTMRSVMKAAEAGCAKATEKLEKAARSGAYSILNAANGINLLAQGSSTAVTACNTLRIGESKYQLGCADANREFFSQMSQLVSEQSDAVLQQLVKVIQGISDCRNQVAELIALFGRVNPALETA